jgi:hypothetical protein
MWRRALQQPTPHVRSLCAGASSDNPIERLLKLASRPKMGLAKAKQSAGQRAIDLSKYTAKFEGMSFQELLQVRCARVLQPLPLYGAQLTRLCCGVRHACLVAG